MKLERFLVSLVPPPGDAWLVAYLAELEEIESSSERRAWRRGLLPVVVSALWTQLRRRPLTFLGGTALKATAASVSILTVLVGFLLAVVFRFADGVPTGVAVLAVVLLTQGVYTLVHVFGFLHRWRQRAVAVQLTGGVLMLGAGMIAFSVGVALNVGASVDDPEFAPMTVAFLIAAHGALSIVAFYKPDSPWVSGHSAS